MKFYNNREQTGSCLFQADERKIIIGDKVFYNKDILNLKVNCILGKLFPKKKNLDKIDLLVDLPPLLGMTGSVTIETKESTYIFSKVYSVMEAYLIFKRIYSGTEATYTYRKKTLSYRYNGGLTDDFFENAKTFAMVFICDENKGFTEQGINKMKDDWSKQCGFRRCGDNENGCFTEYGFYNSDEKWLTFYDDSIEYLNAVGITNQSKIYSKEAHGLPTIMVSVYEGEAFLISYSKGEINHLFLCDPEEKYYESLKCNEVGISKDYHVLEELCEDKEFSIKEIFENKNMSIDHRLKSLAYAFNINSYFISCGFYDIISMDPVSMIYFKNGYKIIENRIRPDEQLMEGSLQIMHQGMPAFEILQADKEIIYGKDFNISFINIGEGSQGFVFCFSSDEIDKIFTQALKGGDIPFNIEKAEIITLNDDINSLDKYENCSKSEQIYDHQAINIDYRQVFGRYAFVCELKDFLIPNGVIVNRDKITNTQEEKLIEWILNRHKITIRLNISSEIILTQPIEFLAIPFANIHRGTAKHLATLNF